MSLPETMQAIVNKVPHEGGAAIGHSARLNRITRKGSLHARLHVPGPSYRGSL